MSIYTTPLQFGYFLALAMALRFWVRSYQESRQSDFFMGLLMLLLALEIQDYTFGFAGINILWNELNGIYRNVRLLLWPTLYFYILSQTNTTFKFKLKNGYHYLPWLIVFSVNLYFFIQGKFAVQSFQEEANASWWGSIPRVLTIVSLAYYGYHIRKVFLKYKKWSQNQFSNTDIVSFEWFRNMLYALLIGFSFQFIMITVSNSYDLDFYQDWWWNLALVLVIFYLGVEGYSQFQPAQILMTAHDKVLKDKKIDQELVKRLNALIQKEKPFLNPDLTLKELANKLSTNSSELSNTINQTFQKNFNDYINDLRIEEFVTLNKLDENKTFTLEALAYDSGFNSKSTFNRAFKKLRGDAPATWLKYNL